MNLQTVGVIGAGVIGGGVAQSLAESGMQVILLDVSENILERTSQQIYNNVRFQGLLKKGDNKSSPREVLGRVALSTDYERLREADFVIENVTEKWDLKESVYKQIESICPPHVVFAANTSAISITRIASVTKRPELVLGMHFMNPVPMKPTVEVVRGYHTSDQTIATAQSLLASMGKEGIVVNDSPGFVSNRVLMLTINESIFLLQDQVATVENVDKIFRTCFGHKMGPLETADLIGLDTVLLSLEVLYDSFKDSKYRPCPLLRKMVDAGLYGQKSGEGFYQCHAAETEL
jgi:3-hydroxybutyryl-CoA dehydrogenase